MPPSAASGAPPAAQGRTGRFLSGLRWGYLNMAVATLGGLAVNGAFVTLARHVGMRPFAVLAPLGPWFVRWIPVSALAIAVELSMGGQGMGRVALAGAGIAVLYAAVEWTPAFRPPLGTYLRSALQALFSRPAARLGFH